MKDWHYAVILAMLLCIFAKLMQITTAINTILEIVQK